jgi:hypothetical protein
MGAGEGFLDRWSRLKRQRATPAVAPAADPPTPPPEHRPPEDPPAPPPDLPDPTSLDAGSDVRAFLGRTVPRALRDAALRRIWAADPAIRDFVGPADYAWDWNTPGGVPGFGGLRPGDDVARLLRQAVGEAGREPPARPEEPADAAEHEVREVATAQPPSVAVTSVADMADVTSMADASAETAAADPPATAGPPRRHGGAVPR